MQLKEFKVTKKNINEMNDVQNQPSKFDGKLQAQCDNIKQFNNIGQSEDNISRSPMKN